MGVDLIPEVASEGNSLAALHTPGADLSQAILIGEFADYLKVEVP
jgi:hypothetical protein